MSDSYAVKRVTARKAHRCVSCGRQCIKPGDVYRQFVIFPWQEPGFPVPMKGKECAFCAERYGRDHMLYPLPPEQDYAVYLKAMQEGRG